MLLGELKQRVSKQGHTGNHPHPIYPRFRVCVHSNHIKSIGLEEEEQDK